MRQAGKELAGKPCETFASRKATERCPDIRGCLWEQRWQTCVKLGTQRTYQFHPRQFAEIGRGRRTIQSRAQGCEESSP